MDRKLTINLGWLLPFAMAGALAFLALGGTPYISQFLRSFQ